MTIVSILAFTKGAVWSLVTIMAVIGVYIYAIMYSHFEKVACGIKWLFRRTPLLGVATFFLFLKTTPTISHWNSVKEGVVSIQPSRATTLTAHVETGPGEHVPPAAVTHQVVARALTRAAQVAQRDAEDAGAEHAVGVAWKPSAV